jgi:hypothetical protein
MAKNIVDRIKFWKTKFLPPIKKSGTIKAAHRGIATNKNL